MLETMREYAHERLVASGEEQAVRSRHARQFLDWRYGSDRNSPGRTSASGWTGYPWSMIISAQPSVGLERDLSLTAGQ